MSTAETFKEQSVEGRAYGPGDEALRRYRRNPAPTPAPPVSEMVDDVEVTDDYVTFHLRDGRIVSVPLAWSWRLLEATPEERQHFEISPSGYGVRWPAVDEDLSGRGALRGTPAPRPGSGHGLRKWREKQRSRSEALWDAPRIKQLRQRLDLSQEDMAERMGVRQATISDWERANQKPSPMACRLLDMLRSGQS